MAVKVFLGGILTAAACNLSMPLTERFEPTGELSSPSTLLYFLVPIIIFLSVIALANIVLKRFGFEGFKADEQWGSKALPAFFTGVFFYLILGSVIAVAMN